RRHLGGELIEWHGDLHQARHGKGDEQQGLGDPQGDVEPATLGLGFRLGKGCSGHFLLLALHSVVGDIFALDYFLLLTSEKSLRKEAHSCHQVTTEMPAPPSARCSTASAISGASWWSACSARGRAASPTCAARSRASRSACSR